MLGLKKNKLDKKRTSSANKAKRSMKDMILQASKWRTIRQHWARWLLLVPVAMVLFSFGYSLFHLWQSGWVDEEIADIKLAFLDDTADVGLKVKHIDVQGREYTQRTELLEALDVHQNAPILEVDLSSARDRIESISWVETATIERILPDTLKIRLIEHKPMALWQLDNQLMLVGYKGAVLTLENLYQYRDYPLIVGAEAPKAAPEILLYLEKLPDLETQIHALSFIGQRRWDLHLKNGMIVKLPEENIHEHLNILNDLASEEELLQKQIKIIDMRYLKSSGQLILRKETSIPHLMDQAP